MGMKSADSVLTESWKFKCVEWGSGKVTGGAPSINLGLWGCEGMGNLPPNRKSKGEKPTFPRTVV